MSRDDIPTPALLLDLDAFEWNIAKMARHLAERSLGFRPHAKTHKCPEIANRLIAAGAKGVCAAKLSEAEVFADAGIPGLLVTTPVIGAQKIARAVQLAQRASDTIFVVDTAENARELNDAAAAAGIVMSVAVDLYFGRTGITPGEPARDLAHVITTLPHLTFVGLQAYDGAAAHTHPFAARQQRTRQTMTLAVETRRLIETSGIECAMVTGGSTGTYSIDSEIAGITELQPGSFLFMDIDYARIGGPETVDYRDFKRALSVVATVVSTQAHSAIVDAGYKSFSTDRPFTPAPIDWPGVTYGWAGDEHGRLDLSGAERTMNVGDRIEFVVPHCDPTVNLYDRFYALRGDRVEDVWMIAARGKSQ